MCLVLSIGTPVIESLIKMRYRRTLRCPHFPYQVSGVPNHFQFSTQRPFVSPVSLRQFHEGHTSVGSVSVGQGMTFGGNYPLWLRNLVDRHGEGEGRCRGRSRSPFAESDLSYANRKG